MTYPQPRTRRHRAKPYRRWPVPTPTVTQLIRKVWGLARAPRPPIDLTLIGDDSTLMDMDAPMIIPSGSMRREEQEFPDAIYASPRIDYLLRDDTRC